MIHSNSPKRSGRNSDAAHGQRPQANPKPARQRATSLRLALETLEDRVVPTRLYLDYGDSFPNNQLTATVGALKNTTSGDNPNIDGPQLTNAINNPDGSGGGSPYPDNTSFTLTSFNSFYGANAAAMRATMNAMVQRFFEPLDIQVVETGSNSLPMISQILGFNEGEAKNNDGYMLIGGIAIGPTNDDPTQFKTNGYGGVSTGTDIGGNNNNDGTGLTLLNTGPGYTAAFLADQIAHEAGHLFGLRHTFGNNPTAPPPGSVINAGLLGSDLMSYLGYTKADPAGLDFFSRYPMVAGDKNTNNDVLSASPTPFDQLLNDPNVGPSSINYVTGTGQNDIITISKVPNLNLASVSVQAFSDPNYNTAIPVPGTNGKSTIYTYFIGLDRTILVDAGAGNDRIVVSADLGPVTIRVRGMAGTDELRINGTAGANTFRMDQDSTAMLIGSGAFIVRYSEIEQLTVDTKSGGDTVTVVGTSVNTVIDNSSGPDTVNVGSNTNIRAPLTIKNAATVSIGPSDDSSPSASVAINSPNAPTTLIMDDRDDRKADTFRVWVSSITCTGFNVTYSVSQIKSLSLLGGTGGCSFLLGDLFAPLDALPADVTVTGGGGTSTLAVNGTGSPDNLYDINAVSVGAYLRFPHGGHFVDSLTNHIFFYNLTGLEVDGNALTNTFNVNHTHAAPTTLYTGAGRNTVQVYGTTGPLAVTGGTGSDTVNFGSGGSVANIRNTVTVINPGGVDTVTVDASADKASTVLLYNNGSNSGPDTVIDGLPTGGDIVLRGADLKSLLIRAGDRGGNIIRIHDTPSLTPDGLMTTVSTGAGSTVTVDGTTGALALDAHGGGNKIFVGSANGSLTRIHGAVQITGSGRKNALTFDDHATTTQQYYILESDRLTRTDSNSVADMAPISFAGLEAITLTGSSGGSVAFVDSTAAGVATTINGQPGPADIFAVGFGSDTTQILGPVSFVGQAADGDFGYYYDYLDANRQTLNISTDPGTPQALLVNRTRLPLVTFGDMSQVIFYSPLVGGSTVNIQGVPAHTVLNMVVGSDTVTLGSLAPTLGGTLTNIEGPVVVDSYSPDDAVTLVLDDSGNATLKNATLTLREDAASYDRVEDFAANTVYWYLGANASVALLGGAADESFRIRGTYVATAIEIDGGGGVNTLDYSALPNGVVVNLTMHTATGLAGGITNIQNVIGGAGADSLTGDTQNNILIGNAGNDSLIGAAGNDILIGGSGADLFSGGSGNDIEIGGTTSNGIAALNAIMAAWGSTTDANYLTQVAGIQSGSISGGFKFDTATVFDDNTQDSITGGPNFDWYWVELLGNIADIITDFSVGDTKSNPTS